MSETDRRAFEGINPDCARNIAVRVVAFMITPSGAKMALSVNDLSNYANSVLLPDDAGALYLVPKMIDLAMKLLCRVRLVRFVAPGATLGGNVYEMAHDVLGVATDKWREEYMRRKAAEWAAKAAKEAQDRELENQRLSLIEKEKEVEREAANMRAKQAEEERRLAEARASQAQEEGRLAQSRALQADEDRRLAQERAKQAEEERRLADIRARQAEEEERQAILHATKAKRQQLIAIAWAASLGIVLLIAVWLYFKAAQESRNAKEAVARGLALREADAALSLVQSEAGRKTPDFDLALVLALQSVLPPENENPENFLPPPQALCALRFAALPLDERGTNIGITQPGDLISYLESYLPNLYTPDRKHVVTLEGLKPVVWDTTAGFRLEFDLPPAPKPVVAMGISSDSQTFVAECVDGDVVVWNLNSGSKCRSSGKKTIVDIAAPGYIKRNLDTDNPQYSSYSEIRDKWFLDALAHVNPLSREDLLAVPFGIQLDRIPADKITNAFALWKTDRKKAKAQLVSAVNPMVRINESMAEKLIKLKFPDPSEIVTQAQINAANNLAKEGKLKEAVEEYNKALHANPIVLKDLKPNEEAVKWQKVGKFQVVIDEANTAAGKGNVEMAVELYKKAKAIYPDLWGNADPVEQARKIAERASTQMKPTHDTPSTQ